MVETKPLDRVIQKWQNRVSIATDDYVQGAVAAANKWKQNTEAAADVWKQAIQQALDRWKQAVASTPADKYAKGIEEKGKDRYAQGVRLAVEEYRSKMAKVLEALKGITLPPRGPRGSPQNIKRVEVIALTLHKLKQQGAFK